MSGVCPRGGVGEQQQVVVGGVRGEVSGGRGGCLSFYHVPQQCRREKLRYPNADERPRWSPHVNPPPPSSLVHCDYAPLSAAVAAATASYVPPSSSLVLNPSYEAAPYDPGIAPIHLLDHHPALFGGNHGHQVQGVSLSLSSAASPSHRTDQHSHASPVLSALALTGQLPPATTTAPRIGPIPAGPFTGYATVLRGSRFLRPARQLLEDACGGGNTMVGTVACSGGEVESLDFPADGVAEYCCEDVAEGLMGDGEHRKMKLTLISMLDEVCRRYKQYYQQIHTVITSFEAVAGLSTAAPYSPVALRSLSKHFKCLKIAICDQLCFANKTVGKEGQSKDEMPEYRIMNGSLCYQKFTHSPGAVNQQPVWRPQRGLPERAVSVLRAWLFEHFLHPYPTDMDKQILARQTGLSRNQVSNWFINARVRLWKPMVEEIHSLEMQQAHMVPGNDSHHDTNNCPDLSSASVSPNNRQTPPTVISHNVPNHPHKRFRDELAQLPNHMKEPLTVSLQDPSSHHRVGAPMSFASAAANGGISLTLGLHQDDGDCLSESLPLNVVHRFGLGLDESGVSYMMGGYEGQERHFLRDLDGQLLRHFIV